jgi:putative Mg2+ transporter-C (MgtC) family protein
MMMDSLASTLSPYLPPIERLALAALLGSILGIEREWHHRTAGLRTNTLIALGSALFTLIAIAMAPPGTDPSRIPSTIVNGVGFLGGGAILRTNGSIHGLTTAATIWVNAAIGMAAGAGHYSLAITGTATTLIVLTVLKRIEFRMDQYRPELTEETPPTVPTSRRQPPAD